MVSGSHHNMGGVSTNGLVRAVSPDGPDMRLFRGPHIYGRGRRRPTELPRAGVAASNQTLHVVEGELGGLRNLTLI